MSTTALWVLFPNKQKNPTGIGSPEYVTGNASDVRKKYSLHPELNHEIVWLDIVSALL